MMEEESNRDRNEASESLVTGNNERVSRLEELLPGIPNEVILEHITTKLSWRSLHSLSPVSRTWRQAIQSRLIYDKRVHSHRTETLVVVNHSHSEETNGFALYSLRDTVFYHLPPIPDVKLGFPNLCQCVGFDGKIYIMGGMESGRFASEKVYVLDLVGHRQWKECASMLEPRKGGGCCVMNGKIYIFGGTLGAHASEMYDPNTDSWSAMEFMRYGFEGRFFHVATMGDELVMGGIHGKWAYHPVKLEWRTRQPEDFRKSAPGRMFMAQGKFHSMNMSQIHVYDVATNSWTLLHLFSLAGIAPGLARIEVVRAVDGELLAAVTHHGEPMSSPSTRTFLIQSHRFNSGDQGIVWQRAHCPLAVEKYRHFTFMRPLQL